MKIGTLSCIASQSVAHSKCVINNHSTSLHASSLSPRRLLHRIFNSLPLHLHPLLPPPPSSSHKCRSHGQSSNRPVAQKPQQKNKRSRESDAEKRNAGQDQQRLANVAVRALRGERFRMLMRAKANNVRCSGVEISPGKERGSDKDDCGDGES